MTSDMDTSVNQVPVVPGRPFLICSHLGDRTTSRLRRRSQPPYCSVFDDMGGYLANYLLALDRWLRYAGQVTNLLSNFVTDSVGRWRSQVCSRHAARRPLSSSGVSGYRQSARSIQSSPLCTSTVFHGIILIVSRRFLSHDTKFPSVVLST